MRSLRNTPRVAIAAAACAFAGLFPANALAQADLSIDVADSADPITTGAEFSYAVTVANAGPETANGVSVEATLPNEIDLLAAMPSQGTCDLQGAKKVNCSLGAIGTAGGTASVEIRVRAQRDGRATATATVASTSPADPNAANNTSTEETVIQNPPAVSCGGKTATIVGTSASETLSGTNKADVIAGLDGDDQILGLDGKDILCGGLGNDLLKGGTGGDVAKGGDGDDRLRGAQDNDELAGNAGNDNIGGGAGNDLLKGGPGSDRCGGGPGADTRKGCE